MTEQPRPVPTAILDRTGRVAPDLACRKCGRNLRAMLPEDRCPQCDLFVSQSVQETLDADGRVQTDIACLKCGYNLRSLTLDGKCPECGSPVADSVRGDLLEFADPVWVSGLAAGATLLLAAGICAVVAIACWKIGGLALALASIGTIAVALLAAVGLLKVTAPEPHAGYRPEGLSARRVCRYSLVATIPLVGVCAFMRVPGWRLSPPLAGALVLTATLIVVFGALPVSLLRHLAALFRRVPNSGHAAMARGLSVGILVAGGIIVIPFVIGLLIPRISGIASIAYIGVFIMAGCALGLLGVLYYARADFANAAELAKSRAGIAAVDQATNDPREN